MVSAPYANPVVYTITLPGDLTAFPHLRATWRFTLSAFVFIVCMFTVSVLAKARISRISRHYGTVASLKVATLSAIE